MKYFLIEKCISVCGVCVKVFTHKSRKCISLHLIRSWRQPRNIALKLDMVTFKCNREIIFVEKSWTHFNCFTMVHYYIS